MKTIPCKSLLLGTICFMIVSCSIEPTHFVCYLSEIDTYLTVTKDRDEIMDIVLNNKPGVSLKSDSVDYIQVKRGDGAVYILYDPSCKSDIYLMCYVYEVDCNKKNFNLIFLENEEFNGEKFRQPTLDNHPDFRPNFRWICINKGFFTVSSQGKVLKEGDKFGGYDYKIPDTLIYVP